VHPPEALRAFPLLSHRCAMREGGRSRRGGAALARLPLAWGRAECMRLGRYLAPLFSHGFS